MMFRNSVLALGAMGLLSLTACSAPDKTATAPDPAAAVDAAKQQTAAAADAAKDSAATAAGAAKDAASTAAGAAKDMAAQATDKATQATDAAKTTAANGIAAGMNGLKSGFGDLATVVNNTKAAVEAGDFAKAKTEFGNFEAAWSKVEDGVKTASPAGYDAVEQGMDAVTSTLNAPQPDKAKVMDALNALGEKVMSVAK